MTELGEKTGNKIEELCQAKCRVDSLIANINDDVKENITKRIQVLENDFDAIKSRSERLKVTMEEDYNRLKRETDCRLAHMENSITSIRQEFKEKLNKKIRDLESKTNKRLANIESTMYKSFTRVGNICIESASFCPVPDTGPVDADRGEEELQEDEETFTSQHVTTSEETPNRAVDPNPDEDHTMQQEDHTTFGHEFQCEIPETSTPLQKHGNVSGITQVKNKSRLSRRSGVKLIQNYQVDYPEIEMRLQKQAKKEKYSVRSQTLKKLYTRWIAEGIPHPDAPDHGYNSALHRMRNICKQRKLQEKKELHDKLGISDREGEVE